ncbi:MAG: AI-2E family transporter, partial [Pseudomonadota bacterium]
VAIWGILALGARWIRRRLDGWAPQPRRLAAIASVTLAMLALVGLQAMLARQARALAGRLSDYEANLDAMLHAAADRIGVEPAPSILDATSDIQLQPLLVNVAGSAASVLGTVMVVVCYVVFLFVESGAVDAKLDALLPDPKERARASKIIGDSVDGIETYLGVQTLVALLQAVLTWALLAWIGLDAPLFWAVMVFALGYIPTLGSFFGTAAPTIFALAQFGLDWQVLAIFVPLTIVQLGASNVLQPAMMGGALNLSPLAVVAAVFGGGAIWGVTGAVLAAPALSVLAIVSAQNPQLRPLAILLSRDGRLEAAHEEDRA